MSTLRDADLSLANWLEQVLPLGTGVRFDAPRSDWERRGSGSAFVSAFLRAVCRDAQDLPRSGWSEARDADGRLVGRQPAPRYFRLTYLVTAWAAAAGGRDETGPRTLEEHELLGLLIDACTDTDTLADDLLAGALAESGIPCFVRCAGEEAGRSTDSLWSGFGISPHAHLVLELTAPVVPRMVTELAPPVREIVLVAGETPALEPAGGGAPAGSGPAERPPARTGGTVRRWERSTIVEPGANGRPGASGQP
ncbi:MAG TPA: Pvc16 family protein, partial [Actinocrinis sp.]|nr:Pvc16 family protein [Actinocrinis sp.]